MQHDNYNYHMNPLPTHQTHQFSAQILQNQSINNNPPNLPQFESSNLPINHPPSYYSPEDERVLRDEVIYLHSLWHRGPPSNLNPPSRTPHFLKPSIPTPFKKSRLISSALNYNLISDKEWPIKSTDSKPEYPLPSESSWPKFKPSSAAVSRPATAEERESILAVKIQLNGLDSSSGLFNKARDSDSDNDDEEEEDDGDDVEEYEFFMKLFEDDNELRSFYEKNCENGEFYCLVCGVLGNKLGRKYKNCVALVQHCVTISKTKKKMAHRGYGNVICKILGWDVNQLPSLPLTMSDATAQSHELQNGSKVNAGEIEVNDQEDLKKDGVFHDPADVLLEQKNTPISAQEVANEMREGCSALGSGSVDCGGAWVLGPRDSRPWAIVHFVGGIFVGAAPQLAYRLFLERLYEKGVLVIATPYASGLDHFSIADEVQFKFDRCLRSLDETVEELPTFGIGHSLGSVVHLLIGSRYAVNRNGNILMAFNNKDPNQAIPLFSPIFLPMTQGMGPLLSQIASSETLRVGAETTFKRLENLGPPIMKQVLPLFEQLPPLYMDLANGRDNFSPKPEETHRIVKTYYGINRNLLIKFKDDIIDETSTLAQVLSVDSAISSILDMSLRTMSGDHGTPLQQALPDAPPAMADAVNRGSELLSNMIAGTPWEAVAKDVSTSLGVDSQILRAETSKDLEHLVDLVSSWMSSCIGTNLLNK